MSQRRIKRHPRKFSAGLRVVQGLKPVLRNLPTTRERLDELAKLSIDEIRVVVDDDPAVMLLTLACHDLGNGVQADYEELARLCSKVSSLLALWELRKGGYIHWVGPLNDEGAPEQFKGFKLTSKASFLKSQKRSMSHAAEKVFETLRHGWNLSRKFTIQQKRTEAYQRGVLPMDKTVAREKIVSMSVTETGMSVEDARRGFEEVEAAGLMGQNEDGSFWVKHPDGDPPGILIPGLYADFEELLH